MMVTFPLVGSLVERFGNRNLAAGGAVMALASVIPFMWEASHGLASVVVAGALFVRGVGLSCIGIPSISTAYTSVKRQDLPMATTALNLVMRMGGPILTTICATFLGWRLAAYASGSASGYGDAFILLCGFHLALVVAAMRLPRGVQKPAA
jgi:MFS family permease